MILPPCISVQACLGIVLYNQSIPFLSLNIFTQTAIQCWYWFYFKPTVVEHYNDIEDARQGIEIMYKRGESCGLIEVINIPSMVMGVSEDSDEYYKARSQHRAEFKSTIDDQQEFEKLLVPLEDETEEDIRKVKPIVQKLRQPYTERERTRWTGPSRIGSKLQLREDFYAVTFLYELKRKTLYKDDIEETEKPYQSQQSQQAPAENQNLNNSNFYKDYPVHRKNMMGKWRFMVITQLLLIWFLGLEAITHDDYVSAFKTPPAGG